MEKHKGNNHLITSSVYICSIYSIHLHFELYISAGHSDTTLPFPISLYVVVYFNPPYRLKPNQRERERGSALLPTCSRHALGSVGVMVVPAQEHGHAPAEDVQPRLVLLQHGVAPPGEPAARGLLPPPLPVRRAHGGARDRGQDRIHGQGRRRC